MDSRKLSDHVPHRAGRREIVLSICARMTGSFSSTSEISDVIAASHRCCKTCGLHSLLLKATDYGTRLLGIDWQLTLFNALVLCTPSTSVLLVLKRI